MEIPRTPLPKIGGGVMHSTVDLMVMLLQTEEPNDRKWLLARVAKHFGLSASDMQVAMFDVGSLPR